MSRRGRPPSYSEEQRERVLALAAEGCSQRQIAEEVFGDARLHGRVERILKRLPTRPVPELPREEGEDFEALLASGGEMATVVALVARYERWLIESGTVASPADIERLLRIKTRLAAWATVERLNALTRQLPDEREDVAEEDDDER